MKYFTLNELIKSDTATKYGIKNEPNEAQKQNLLYLIEHVLEPARAKLGMPIIVTSGYRNPQLNAKVGGSASSQHKEGEAVDVTCADNTKLYNIFKTQGKFDQLIWEKGNDKQPAWVHVSVKRNGKNRKQELRIK